MSCNCNKEHGVCCGDSEGNDDIRNDLIRIAVTAALFVAAFIAELVFHAEWYIYVGLFAAAYTACSYEAYIDCVRNIAEGEIFNESFLMIIASLGAFCIGQYPEAVAVMMFFGVGELFEDYAVDRSRKSVSALLQIVPDHAWVLRDGKEVQVNPSEVETGETIIIRSGERVPLDCVITSGSSSMDTVALTGESVPRSVFPGNEILAGMVNVTAKLTAEVIRPYSESAVSRIMRMIEESSSKKAKTERFIRVFAKYYTPAVCALALSVAAIPIALGYDAGTWIYRALTLLVVSCPCALVISVPMGFFCGIGCASRNGILVKGGNYLEMLSKADTIVFDKTGTLTEGTFEVTSIKPVEMTSEELMEMAVKAEYYSDHPISASIKRGYGKVPTPDGIGESEVIPGRGVRTEVHGRSVHIGNLKLMSEIGISVTEHDTPGTKVHVARDGKYHGHIEVADTVKNDSKWAVSELKKLGINRTVMLTGDIGRTAGVVGRDIGIDDIRADLLPGQKLEALEEIMSTSNGSTVFIGDGINDAPSLARADVGIAMGGIGSDAAIEAADIVLVNDAPSGAVTVLRIAKKTMSVVKQNIVFPLTIKVAIIVLAAVGIAGMPVAIFGDVGVLIIAILNSTRCLTVKGTVPKEYSRYADKAEKNV